MKSEKGITLVALILIIVLLVILAGISFAIVITNESDEENTNTVVDTSGVTYTESNEVIEASYTYINNSVNTTMYQISNGVEE